jgi:hypothetical protein
MQAENLEFFTWCPVKYEVDTSIFAKELDQVPDNYWYYDRHRNTEVLYLYISSEHATNNISTTGNLKWTDAITFCPQLKYFLEKEVIEEIPGKISVLRTRPDVLMNIHMDAYIEENNTEQYKWRMVVKGDKKGLFFLNENEDKIYPNQEDWEAYVMDGVHPHGIDRTITEKMTIVIGTPWRGNPLPKNLVKEKVCKIQKPNLKKEWECR